MIVQSHKGEPNSDTPKDFTQKTPSTSLGERAETCTTLDFNSFMFQLFAFLPDCLGDNITAAGPAHPQPVWSASFLSISLSFPQACLQHASDGDKSQLN